MNLSKVIKRQVADNRRDLATINLLGSNPLASDRLLLAWAKWIWKGTNCKPEDGLESARNFLNEVSD